MRSHLSESWDLGPYRIYFNNVSEGPLMSNYMLQPLKMLHKPDHEHNRPEYFTQKNFIFYHFIGQLYESIKWPRKCPPILAVLCLNCHPMCRDKRNMLCTFRNMLNCTAMDIMYYTSPLFRMEIWSALQYELNRLYQMFTQRNPTFEANGGKVSIVSHSLGNSLLSPGLYTASNLALVELNCPIKGWY